MIVGTGALLNAEVFKIGLEPVGLVGLFVISLIIVIIFLIHIGVNITIAQQRYFQKNVLVSEAFVTTVRKIPNILRLSIIQIAVFSLLFIPFIQLSDFSALIDFNLSIFLTNQFYEASSSAMLIYVCMMIGISYVLIKGIFLFHFTFIEEKTIWEGFKLSWRLTSFQKLKIILTVVIFNLLLVLVILLTITLLAYLPTILAGTILGNLIREYLVLFSSYVTFLFSLLLMPLNIVMLTRLFYFSKREHGEQITNPLMLTFNKKLKFIEIGLLRLFHKKRHSFLFLLIIVIISMFLLSDKVHDRIVYLKWNVQVAAHRGDIHSAPENSLSSIRAAIEKGVDAVEFDVMLTKDDVVILNHDATLQRVAGIPRRVQDMTFEEVSRVDIGKSFSEEFIGERIPTLEKVLAELVEEKIAIIIDLKPGDTNGKKLAHLVVNLVEMYNMEEATYIQAFDYDVLQEVRKRNSNIRIGQILYLAAGDLSSLDVDFYTIRQTMLSERFIQQARAQNREVWVWTVNIERNIREVLTYDIDGIITNYPEMVQRMIGIK